jgi:putative sugar O-methyltransferase
MPRLLERIINKMIRMYGDLILLPKIYKSDEQLLLFKQVSHKYSLILKNVYGDIKYNNHVYHWEEWADKIKMDFEQGLPLDFLRHNGLRALMVFSDRKIANYQLNDLRKIFSQTFLIEILLEDYIGKPQIINEKYKTSANRIHHLFHLGNYSRITHREIWSNKIILEWGGGYGNMARLIKKMNPNITYLIFDLPQIVPIQYIYLATLFGENNVNLINDYTQIVSNKFNLVAVNYADNFKKLKIDGFISTWALTESSKIYQTFCYENNFFNAKSILLAYAKDENNFIFNQIGTDNDFHFSQIKYFPKNHQYAFR